MMRIAVIHMGAIGDLVQTLPTLRALRRHRPEATVTFIGRPARAALARLAGVADVCQDYDVRPATTNADLVVDFLGVPSSASPPAGRTVINVSPLPPAGWTDSAAAWIFRAAAPQLGLPAAALEPEIPVPPETVEWARAALARAGVRGGFVALHPGSGSVRKNWPMERFAEIARRLRNSGRQVVWLAGPAERERGTPAAAAPACPLLEETPLDVLAGVLALAEAYLGNDSGITQVAAAVRRPGGGGTPTVALFGPTDARIWAPRGKHVRVVQAKGGVMDALDADPVEAAVQSLRS
jgi:heptosyltransferase III